MPGKVFDIPRYNDLPLAPPTFFTEKDKGQAGAREPTILVFPPELGIKPIYLSTGKKIRSRKNLKKTKEKLQKQKLIKKLKAK